MIVVTIVRTETDYPPKANAGSNVIMSLPKNSVTLYGNKSTDDKGIATYEWIKKSDSDKLAADMRVRHEAGDNPETVFYCVLRAVTSWPQT